MTENSLRIRKVERAIPTALLTAESLANHGRFDDALAELHAVQHANPELAPAHFLEGLIHWRRKSLLSARYSLELSTQLDGTALEGWHALASVCRELKDYPAALQAIDRILRRESRDADAHLLRGTVLMQMGRQRAASAAFRCALRSDPTLTAAHLHLARLALDANQPQLAYRRLRAVTQLGTLHYDSLLEIGALLERLEKFEEAQAHYRRLIRQFPTRATPYVKLAQIFLDQGFDLEALPLLSLAVRIEPKNVQALEHLAQVFQRQGRADTATELLQSARLIESAIPHVSPTPGAG